MGHFILIIIYDKYDIIIYSNKVNQLIWHVQDFQKLFLFCLQIFFRFVIDSYLVESWNA